MKGKRSKQYRKLMQNYQLNFQFREPYQVLFDAQILKDAARFKMDFGKMLSNTLHGEIKPMITTCCIRHLYNEPQFEGKDAVVNVAKAVERRRCGHHELDEPLSALECLESVVDGKGSGNNKHKYVVATQDINVRKKMRKIVGVPLVYIEKSVMILEPMPKATQDVRERELKAKTRVGLIAGRNLGQSMPGEKRMREDEGDENGEDAAPAVKKQKKAKGPKGPNPLAVKKAKKENDGARDKQEADPERTAARKITKREPQAGEKTGVATAAGDGEKGSEAPVKRKRKRKTKDTTASADASHPDSGDEDN